MGRHLPDPHALERACRAAAWLAVVIVAGLASRRYPDHLPGPIAKETGDALWATAAFLGLRLVRPRWSTSAVAAASLTAAVLIEFSQAYHQPTLDRLRAHALGHLLLGSGFSWADQLAYVVGVAIALPVDVRWLARRPRPTRTDSSDSACFPTTPV